MSFPEVPLRAYARPGVVLVACAAVLWGCGPGDIADPTRVTGAGAVLTVNKSAVTAGEEVELDVTGTRLPAGTKPAAAQNQPDDCPTSVYFFTNDELGADEHLELFPTIVIDGVCRIGKAVKTVKLDAAKVPGTRDQKIYVVAEGVNRTYDRVRSTQASVSVKVTTPEPGSAPAPAPAPAPSATPTPSATPAPTPPAPATPIACNSHTNPFTGQLPYGTFFWNPDPGVAGSEMEFDASGSYDPDGTITRYRWDFNGDGTADADSTSPTARYTPPSAGPLPVCLEVTDNSGNVYASNHFSGPLQIQPTGYLVARAFSVAPDPPVAGATTTFTAADVPGTEELLFFSRVFDPPAVQPASDRTWDHTYASSGSVKALVVHRRGDGSPGNPNQESTWTRALNVRASARSAVARTAASKAKTIKLVAQLKATRVLVSAGRLSLVGSTLSTKKAVVKGRMSAKLSASQKKKLPKALAFLTNADYAASFSGRRVELTPSLSGLAGTGYVLAQARKDTRTRVCLRVTTDGFTVAGTRWSVVGATGRAAGWTGSGTISPPLVGDASGLPRDRSTLSLRKAGARKSVSKCRALYKNVPKQKKAK